MMYEQRGWYLFKKSERKELTRLPLIQTKNGGTNVDIYTNNRLVPDGRDRISDRG
jgi:hypothetical protein